MNSALVLLVLVVSVAYAQIPPPCVSPPQWESRYIGYDSAKGGLIRARLSYDSIYRRERIIEEFQLGREDDFFDTLYLHNQQIEYRFNLKTKECTKTAVTRPWIDVGIPPNATFRGESYIGSSAVPGANILATIWTNEFTDEKGDKFSYMGAWTYEACLPIIADYFSKTANVRYHSQYFDITPGLDDPNVFIPRRECL